MCCLGAPASLFDSRAGLGTLLLLTCVLSSLGILWAAKGAGKIQGKPGLAWADSSAMGTELLPEIIPDPFQSCQICRQHLAAENLVCLSFLSIGCTSGRCKE